MNLRTAPSGEPIEGTAPDQTLVWDGAIWVPQSSPIVGVPEVCGYVHADSVVRAGSDLIEWPNQRSGEVFTLGTGSPGYPQVVELGGRQLVQFTGIGVTGGGGSWLESTEQALLYPWRYLTSQATFWFAAVVQANATVGQHIVASVSNPAVTNNWQALFVYQNAANWKGSWNGQNGGPVAARLVDDSPPDTAMHLWEVTARVNPPGVANPGVYHSIRVDGVVRQAFLPAATISDYGPFSVFTLGTVQRIEYSDPFGGYARSFAWAYPAPSEQALAGLRQQLASDAGVTLAG